MFDPYKYKIGLTLSILAFTISACGAASQTQAQISTAVAQTVQAQNSLTKIANAPTLTPAPSIEITATVLSGATNTSAPVLSAPGCTVSARLAAEDPPDGAILNPSQSFWKTWSLENTGTCIWDSTYKLVYWSGDLMGGLNSYPLPQEVAPDEIKDISIFLKTPDSEGTFTGYWSIQTPWNTYFGAGPAGDPFYVEVVVSNAAKPQYGITSVTYNIVRDPVVGCPRFIWFTVFATISTNGPFEFSYFWEQIDDNDGTIQKVKFTQADSITVSRQWRARPGDNPNPQWMRIVVVSPERHEYEKATFQHNCQ